jgi:TatD DNase family protein
VLDSHCHLDFPEFDADRARLLADARAVGVVGWLVPGVHEGLWDAQEALQREPGIRLAVGLHPWWVEPARDLDEAIAALDLRVRRLGAAAVGECGLDAKRGEVAVAQQLSWFEAQLELARDRDLPVIVHQVGAREEFLRALGRAGRLPRGGVVHGFSGDAAWAQALVQRGWHLGFGMAPLGPRRERLREAFRSVPIESVLLETDAPASRKRGQRSVPADIVATTFALAAMRGISSEELRRLGDANLAAFLGLGSPEAFVLPPGGGRVPEALL